MVTKFFTFSDACAHPGAKRLVLQGRTGPVNAVEADGTLYIEDDEAEAKAAAKALCSKPLELASEVAVASEVAQASSEVAPAPKPTPEPAAALDFEPFCSVETSSAPAVHRISYSAAASKPPVGPKPSAAGFELRSIAASKFSAGLKCSTPAFQPAVVSAPLEVSMHDEHMHVHTCRYMQVQRVHPYICQTVEVDDFAVAQNTPLPECVAGIEGDKV